jgi:hypothetical protein
MMSKNFKTKKGWRLWTKRVKKKIMSQNFRKATKKTKV